MVWLDPASSFLVVGPQDVPVPRMGPSFSFLSVLLLSLCMFMCTCVHV